MGRCHTGGHKVYAAYTTIKTHAGNNRYPLSDVNSLPCCQFSHFYSFVLFECTSPQTQLSIIILYKTGFSTDRTRTQILYMHASRNSDLDIYIYIYICLGVKNINRQHSDSRVGYPIYVAYMLTENS